MTSVVRSRRVLAILGACTAVALAGASLTGQAPSQTGSTATDPALRLKSFDAHVAMRQSSPFKSLVWQFLGPTNISGRVTDVAVVTTRGKFYTIYVATATGGLWKTDNDGVTWAPVFDQGVTTSIGDVTIAPSNPSIVWVGTGEANIFRSSNAGGGVYRSTDGGQTCAEDRKDTPATSHGSHDRPPGRARRSYHGRAYSRFLQPGRQRHAMPAVPPV